MRVVCRPEASVAPGTIFSKSIYPSEGPVSVISSWRNWLYGQNYNSHLPSQGKMTPEAEDDPVRRLPLQLEQVLLCWENLRALVSRNLGPKSERSWWMGLCIWKMFHFLKKQTPLCFKVLVEFNTCFLFCFLTYSAVFDVHTFFWHYWPWFWNGQFCFLSVSSFLRCHFSSSWWCCLEKRIT